MKKMAVMVRKLMDENAKLCIACERLLEEFVVALKQLLRT